LGNKIREVGCGGPEGAAWELKFNGQDKSTNKEIQGVLRVAVTVVATSVKGTGGEESITGGTGTGGEFGV
jgi:hypothetical protein